MTKEQQAYLSECNCMIQVGESWLPSRKAGDDFFTPNGMKIQPSETEFLWRATTHNEIVHEMDERGDVPMIQG